MSAFSCGGCVQNSAGVLSLRRVNDGRAHSYLLFCCAAAATRDAASDDSLSSGSVGVDSCLSGTISRAARTRTRVSSGVSTPLSDPFPNRKHEGNSWRPREILFSSSKTTHPDCLCWGQVRRRQRRHHRRAGPFQRLRFKKWKSDGGRRGRKGPTLESTCHPHVGVVFFFECKEWRRRRRPWWTARTTCCSSRHSR